MPPPVPEFIRLLVASPDFMGEYLERTKLFVQGMMNRLTFSHQKYGSIHDSFPTHRTGVAQIQPRLEKYLETGNTEWLIDIANYALIEYICPSVKGAHFRATGSEESPGAVNNDGSVSHGKIGE